jgi:hypothetical protein
MAGVVPAVHALGDKGRREMPGNKLALGPAEGRSLMVGHDRFI